MCELRYDVREGLVNEGYSYSGRRVAYHLLGLTRCLRAPRSPTKYRQSVFLDPRCLDHEGLIVQTVRVVIAERDVGSSLYLERIRLDLLRSTSIVG